MNRIAVIGIIVEEPQEVEKLNQLLHEYGSYIIGRMGIPYRERKIHVISIAMDAMPATAPLRTADLRIVLCILSASIVCWLIWNRFCCRPTVRFRPLKDNENHLRLMNSSFCNVPIFCVFRL